jgi:branched-chain amino acid transport system ATP-binding protein
MAENILALKCVSVRYGGVTALDGVDFELGQGELLALMGPNGSGKTTILKALFGLVPLHSGAVYFEGSKISPRPERLVRAGVVMVPQGRRVFPSLSVRENLLLGQYVRGDLLGELARVLELFPALRGQLEHPAGKLSGGQQQMVAIGRGLMSSPRILLLDEPTLGLAPKLVKEVFATIKKINTELGVSIVVVEHNIRSLLDIADRGIVLDKGKVAMKGRGAELREAQIMEKVFLGAWE